MYYLDSNIVIYHITDNAAYGKAAHRLMKRIAAREMEVCTSVYLFAEVFATLRFFRKTTSEIYEHLKDLANVGVIFVDLTPSIIIEALEQYRTGLKLGDAIHYTTAQLIGIPKIITEDKHFDTLEGVERLSLQKLQETAGSE
ncbi:MAG: type II toxin-antitoxin system VapC family toxin [Candidatus Thorarchaeota archaeon]